MKNLEDIPEIDNKKRLKYEATKQAITNGLFGGLCTSIVLSETPIYFQFPASLVGVGIGAWAGYQNYYKKNKSNY
jgi:hypothetical protein